MIQAVLVPEFGGLHAQNADGEGAFLNEDVSQPNEAFFRSVDWLVERTSVLRDVQLAAYWMHTLRSFISKGFVGFTFEGPPAKYQRSFGYDIGASAA